METEGDFAGRSSPNTRFLQSPSFKIFVNLAAGPRDSYLAHKGEIDRAIARVLDSGKYILSDEVSDFENEFASFVGAQFVVGVASGTDALHLALKVLGVGAGDEVATVSHTATATVAAIELAGAVPVLVDADPLSYTMDPELLEDTLKSDRRHRIKAVIPVHLYGHPADMDSIREITTTYERHVVEDCAQSHGASIRAQNTGNWGIAAAFSFYPTKNLGALGDAGALILADSQLAEKARLLRQYGWKRRFISELQGMNSRLDPLQAAVLRAKLPYLEGENARRRHLASVYDASLPQPIRPGVSAGVTHVFHQYVIATERRDELRNYLARRSVPTAVHYPLPIHMQPAYAGRVRIGEGGLEQTEMISRAVLSLPIHPGFDDESVQYVGRLIADFLQ